MSIERSENDNSIFPDKYLLEEYSEYFVAPNDEYIYCLDHGLDVNRFDNGSVLFAGSHLEEDTSRAEINFCFPCGSIFDPIGKLGLSHLVEHGSANRHLFAGEDDFSNFNAVSTHTYIQYLLSGLAREEYPEIGIWPLLNEFLDNLRHPSMVRRNYRIDTKVEVNNLLHEITLRKSDHDYLLSKLLYACMLEANNPHLIETIGAEADLKSISESDVDQKIHQIFRPNGLFVSVRAFEHQYPIREKLVKFIGDQLRKIDKSPLVLPPAPDDKRYQQMSPVTEQPIIMDLGLTNGLVSVIYAWNVRFKPFTSSCMLLYPYVDLVNKSLFRFTRSNGLAYQAFAERLDISRETGIVYLRLDMSKNHLSEQFCHPDTVIRPVLKVINRNLMQSKIDAMMIKNQIGLRKHERLANDAEWSLKDVGRILNTDVAESKIRPNINDMKFWHEYFNSVRPQIIIAGDLSHISDS